MCFCLYGRNVQFQWNSEFIWPGFQPCPQTVPIEHKSSQGATQRWRMERSHQEVSIHTDISLFSQLIYTLFHAIPRKHLEIIGFVQSCHTQLLFSASVRWVLNQSATVQLFLSLVLSHLDCCQSVLVGLPFKELLCLRIIQNNAARLVSENKNTQIVSLCLSGYPLNSE